MVNIPFHHVQSLGWLLKCRSPSFCSLSSTILVVAPSSPCFYPLTHKINSQHYWCNASVTWLILQSAITSRLYGAGSTEEEKSPSMQLEIFRTHTDSNTSFPSAFSIPSPSISLSQFPWPSRRKPTKLLRETPNMAARTKQLLHFSWKTLTRMVTLHRKVAYHLSSGTKGDRCRQQTLQIFCIQHVDK